VKIGFIGMGNMGRPMAANLLQAGHKLAVHTRTKAKAQELLARGAIWADTPAGAALGQDIVFTCLPLPADVEAVVFGEHGIQEAIPSGAVFIDTSTSSPTCIRRIHEAFAKRHVAVLDAPLSGGPVAAEKGALAIIVGGDEVVFKRVKPVLDVIGDPQKVVYCGPIGSGMVCKLCNNMINLALGVLVPEALTLGMRAGVKLDTLVDVISKSTGNTCRMDVIFRMGLFKGNFEPGFSLALGHKDLRLALELARELSVPMEMAALAEQKHVEATARGLASKNTDAIALLQEERTGVQLRLSQGGDSR
jgi:3-hydroxyisobutyrate dehydrogenase